MKRIFVLIKRGLPIFYTFVIQVSEAQVYSPYNLLLPLYGILPVYLFCLAPL